MSDIVRDVIAALVAEQTQLSTEGTGMVSSGGSGGGTTQAVSDPVAKINSIKTNYEKLKADAKACENKVADLQKKFNELEKIFDALKSKPQDMDTDLQLSRMQAVMGGSQGYRHQYYQLLLGLVHFGVAPSRGQHFYELAREAFQRGDRYWGFRFLARMLHFVQDVNQPYHTRPIRFAWLWETGFSLDNLIRVGKNMHYGYEHYVSAHLLRQLQAKPPLTKQPYLRAVAQARPQPVSDVESFIRDAARTNYRQRSNATLRANDAYWPARVRAKAPQMQSETPDDLFGRDGSPEQQRMEEVTARNLLVTAQDTRSLLEYARQTIVR